MLKNGFIYYCLLRYNFVVLFLPITVFYESRRPHVEENASISTPSKVVLVQGRWGGRFVYSNGNRLYTKFETRILPYPIAPPNAPAIRIPRKKQLQTFTEKGGGATISPT